MYGPLAARVSHVPLIWVYVTVRDYNTIMYTIMWYHCDKKAQSAFFKFQKGDWSKVKLHKTLEMLNLPFSNW